MPKDEALGIPFEKWMEVYLRAQCWTLATIVHAKACSQILMEVQM